MSTGASPVAHTSNVSSHYALPASPTSAAYSTTLDDAISGLLTRYLPTFFDLLEKFQYEKAMQILEEEEETQWKNWDVFIVMLKLAASCESTYHLMRYLEADLVQSDTIEHMYGKLLVLMNHLADELKPIAARQSRFCSIRVRTPKNYAEERDSSSANGRRTERDGGDDEYIADHTLMAELETCGDLSYFVELLEQGADFFSLRISMIQIYRGLAISIVRRDYHSILKRMDDLLLRFDTFNHPLLETMRQSSIEELSTVHAAFQCEIRVTEYDFTRSIVALHRLKVRLRCWSDHIDTVSDYPLFEGNGKDFGADGDDERLLLDESDDLTSNFMCSDTSHHSSSSRSHVFNSSLSDESSHIASGTSCGISSSFVESLVSNRGGRLGNMCDNSYEVADAIAALDKHQLGVSLNTSVSPASTEVPSTFRRLLSHSSLLLRNAGPTSGLHIPQELTVANSSMPSDALEQAILGGGGNGTRGTGGTAGPSLGNSQGASNGGGMVGSSMNPIAAEMMASSMKNQERDDGFALPVFLWAKRFYRSLVAKFTLYFHRWLEPFEKKADYLALELTRFIKTPLGISYLQLMDVLLSRSSCRGDGSKMCIMLVLETQALENKGAHYYENGYRCPNSTNALYTSTTQERKKKEEETRHRSNVVADTLGMNSCTPSPVSSRGGGVSPANGRRRSADQHAHHTLFMRVDREENEEQNDFSELWGLRSWPAVFCYPEGSAVPLDHWPNIVSLIMDSRSSLDSVRPVFMHFERRLKTTYHITRVDDATYLVLFAEGVQKFNEKVAQDFMQTVTENLQHSGAFAPGFFVANSPSSA